jgi:hypothetical protein
MHRYRAASHNLDGSRRSKLVATSAGHYSEDRSSMVSVSHLLDLLGPLHPYSTLDGFWVALGALYEPGDQRKLQSKRGQDQSEILRL